MESFVKFRLNYFSKLAYYFSSLSCFNTFLKGVARGPACRKLKVSQLQL